MLIKRLVSCLIQKRLNDPKAILLIGPRQAGKTTLLRQLTLKMEQPILWWNGDEPDIRQILSNVTSTHLKNLIGKHTLLVIDEAQRIENIGMTIKLIVDNIPGVKVLAIGSSAFELANGMNEPLTELKWQYHLYPLSWEEMVNHHGLLEERRLLSHRLIYGYYPDIVEHAGDETALLSQLADSYLYKDILILENIQKPDRLERLVQALAFQIGSQVSYAVIKHFNPVGLRDDTGALWENFLVSERFKRMANRGLSVNCYFWRTAQQQEIDYLEERDGKLFAWEFKWSNASAKARFPKTFTSAYPHSETKIITPDNMDGFLM